MPRKTLTPAVPGGQALDELKDWLAITTASEDVPLAHALLAALDLCEGFTGLVPLEAVYEDLIPASPTWHTLAARPIHAVTHVEAVAADGTRSTLPVQAYAIDLGADGSARVRLSGPNPPRRLAVRFAAGLAPDWTALPPGLRHGVIRLAAELYRDRTETGTARTPPAAVAALWRPWRSLCLA